MNILILTGKFGMGHCCAAQAVREQFLDRYPDANITVVDMPAWLYPTGSRALYGCFNCAVHYIPFVYNLLNRFAEHFSGIPLKKTICSRLARLFSEIRPDLVISTLPFSSQYISAYQESRRDKTPLFTYVTDLTVHDAWISTQTERYFVGSEDVRAALAAKGIPGERITVSGIPVRDAFSHETQLCTVQSETHEVLVMGGGLGLLPGSSALLRSLSAIDTIHLTVLTGRNERLRRRLNEQFPRITALGWTDDVAALLRRSELLITKAGGITTFEAIESGTPLYILRPFLMQEVGNARFIERESIGRVFWGAGKNAAGDIFALLNDRGLVRQMRANMYALRNRRENAVEIMARSVQPQ